MWLCSLRLQTPVRLVLISISFKLFNNAPVFSSGFYLAETDRTVALMLCLPRGALFLLVASSRLLLSACLTLCQTLSGILIPVCFLLLCSNQRHPFLRSKYTLIVEVYYPVCTKLIWIFISKTDLNMVFENSAQSGSTAGISLCRNTDGFILLVFEGSVLIILGSDL